MKRAYFVDTSAYLAYAKNEFWTPALSIGDVYAPKTIINELSSLTDISTGKVSLNKIERRRLDELVSKTNVIESREISSEVLDAHNRSIVRRQILNPNTIMGDVDLSLVEVAKSYSSENLDLRVVVFTADVTMGSAVDLINRENL